MHSIEINMHDSGIASGYCSQNLFQLKNWLMSLKHDPEAICANLAIPINLTPVKRAFPFAILKNIQVNECCRGEGVGNSLMSDFLAECAQHDADVVFLDCDLEESNEFDLAAWYQGFGFQPIGETTLMVRFEKNSFFAPRYSCGATAPIKNRN